MAFRSGGKGNTTADGLRRFPIRPPGSDPLPSRELRPKFRTLLAKHCWSMDVDMISGDEGRNPWRYHFGSPARPAFQGPLPPGRLRQFSRVDLIDMALGRIRRSVREDWLGMRAPVSGATVERMASRVKWVYQSVEAAR